MVFPASSYHKALHFDQAPFLVIWETTRACALACRHCRAEAIDWSDPNELTLSEAAKLIDEIAEIGTKILVFSGGDPLQRLDLEFLVCYAHQRGLRTATIPAATPRLTYQRLCDLKNSGLDQIAFSLDGWDEASHDTFRQVDGSFAKTMQGVTWAQELKIPLQINTCFSRWNFDHFNEIAQIVDDCNVVFWEVFFLVPVGRGEQLQSLTAQEFEILFEKLYQHAKRARYVIKVTEAPHYRRYVLQQQCNSRPGMEDPSMHLASGNAEAIPMSSRAVNSGKGFCFVSHTGDVYPSGFLPVSAGNIRTSRFADMYQNSNLFKQLRDPNCLKGKCGYCEYRDLCGGSRSRAYALTGDCLAQDDSCAYEPRMRSKRASSAI